MDTTTIAYWKGVPLAEVPRDELEAALCETYAELQRVRDRATQASIGEIKALAEGARVRLTHHNSVLSRLFG